LVRECEGSVPNVMARYDFGVEKRVFTEGMTEQEIDGVVGTLISDADKINSSAAL